MIEDVFKAHFGERPEKSAFTPGRVNLIGEHTDYNGGWVLPTALPLGVDIAIKARKDHKVRIISEGFEGVFEGNVEGPATGHWSDYVRGALQFANLGLQTDKGADVAIKSTLPHGAGLSSSAAITVGMLALLSDLSGTKTDTVEIAKLARTVENDFIGVPCGIMDQMAVALATPGQALKIDTDTLAYSVIDIPKTHHMAVIHSGQFRKLNEGRYKERKKECDTVKAQFGRNDICKLTPSDLASIENLPDHIKRRAKHCSSEHERTIQASEALRHVDMERFGQLMNESHVSMRDDFEISLPDIDSLVNDAVKFGALGARLTGGGFGGCIVACVETNELMDWKEQLLSKHEKAFYVC